MDRREQRVLRVRMDRRVLLEPRERQELQVKQDLRVQREPQVRRGRQELPE